MVDLYGAQPDEGRSAGPSAAAAAATALDANAELSEDRPCFDHRADSCTHFGSNSNLH